MQAQPAAIRHDDGTVVQGIIEFRQAVILTGSGQVQVGRAFHVERFVRALVIEFLDEAVEGRLLLENIHAWRASGFLLESQVHAFVAAVLLRLARRYTLDVDTKAEPPDGKFAEVEKRIGGSERDAVIGADRPGQTTPLEETLESGKGRSLFGGFHRLAQQDKA